MRRTSACASRCGGSEAHLQPGVAEEGVDVPGGGPVHGHQLPGLGGGLQHTVQASKPTMPGRPTSRSPIRPRASPTARMHCWAIWRAPALPPDRQHRPGHPSPCGRDERCNTQTSTSWMRGGGRGPAGGDIRLVPSPLCRAGRLPDLLSGPERVQLQGTSTPRMGPSALFQVQ